MTTTTFSPGDKVRVTGDSADLEHEFPRGTVGEIVLKGGESHLVTTVPSVRAWSEGVCCWVAPADLERVEEPPAANPEPAAPLDVARLKALGAARALLGDTAEGADLVEVARFILGEGGGNVPTDNAPAVAAVNTTVPLEITDTDDDVARYLPGTLLNPEILDAAPAPTTAGTLRLDLRLFLGDRDITYALANPIAEALEG